MSQKQRGASLFIALIALVTMTLAGIALVRSVDTTNFIAGNIAFRQATLHATDFGMERAIDALPAILTNFLDLNYPAACTTKCNYYPTLQDTNASGIPTPLNAGGVPTAIDWTDPFPDSTTINTDYTVKYVIDRLCTGPTPITNFTTSCYAEPATGGGSKKSGATVFSGAQAVYYRITVRVEGPRNTSSVTQAIISR